MIIDDNTKYKIDLIRNSCIQSDWNDRQEKHLNGDERIYVEALIGTLAQQANLIPFFHSNQTLLTSWLNRIKLRILVVTPTLWELEAIQSGYLRDKYDLVITDDYVKGFEQPWKNPFYNVKKVLQRTIDQYQNRVDGILGTGDLYGSVFAAYLSEQMNLPGSKTRSLLIFNHKY